MLLQIPSPSAICLSGSSGSGKTVLVKKIIDNVDSFYANPKPNRILYCYAQFQQIYAEIENTCSKIEFHRGLPTQDQLDVLSNENSLDGNSSLIILDDLQEALINSPLINQLFTVTSHHSLINVIYLKQNLFSPGKYSRTVSLNTHCYILTSNYRDIRQISLLGSQIYSSQNILLSAYLDCMKTQFNYLMVDLHPKSCKDYQLRTAIFDQAVIIYQKI